MTTKLATNIAVDDPVPQTAALRTDRSDRRYIDDQVLAIQQHLVDSALSGIHATWFRLAGSSVAVIEGDCVCMVAATAADNFQLVTKALAAALADAKSVTGVVLQGGAPGSLIRVAIGGMVPSSITGLPASTGAVRVNPSTGRCDRVATIANTDYPIGTVNSIGTLTITPTLSPGLQNFSVSNAIYTIDISSAAPSAGKVVALKSGSANELLLVVAVSGAFQGGPLGVLPATHVAGDTNAAIAIGGTLPNSITGLGNSTDGKPHDVTWDLTTGSLQYLYKPSGGELIIGHSPGDGRLTIAPTTENDRAAARVYNPKTFGAFWDGIHDDTAAWNAMMAAIPLYTAAKIILPPGFGYFAGDRSGNFTASMTKLSIKRYVTIEGNGGGCEPEATAGTAVSASGFELAPGCALQWEEVWMSDDGGSGQYGHLKNCHIRGKSLIVSDSFGASIYNTLGFSSDNRVAGTYVGKGRCVVYSGTTVTASGVSKTDITLGGQSHTEIMFRAQYGFTPSGAEPAAFATATVANIGNLIDDGTNVGAWKVEGVPKDYRASTVYVAGQRVWCPGDPRLIYECVTGGTTSNAATHYTDPNFISPQINTTFTDGTVVWKVYLAGLDHHLCPSTKTDGCVYTGGFGPGWMVWGGAVDGNEPAHHIYGDFTKIRNCEFHFGGGGAWVFGQETAGFRIQDCQYFGRSGVPQMSYAPSPDDVRMGDGTVGFWVRADAGGIIDNCYVQFNHAPGYVVDNSGAAKVASPQRGAAASETLLLDAKSEAAFDDLVYSGAIKIGVGDRGEQADSDAPLIRPNKWRGVLGFETDPASKVVNYLVQQLNTYTQTYGIQAGADATGNRWFAWWTDRINATTIKTGLHVLGLNAWNGVAQHPRWALGVTYGDANNVTASGPGIGLLYIADGWFTRDDAEYYGFSSRALRTPSIRNGLRKVFDSFPYPSATGAVGTFRRISCTTQGVVGQIWSNVLTYFVENSSAGILGESIRVTPSTAATIPDGTHRTWKLSVLGSGNTGVEPVWPASGNFTDAASNQWVDEGLEPTFKPSDFVDGNVIGRIPQTRTLRKDTASTDSGTAAAKSELASFVFQATTTTNAANQVLCTLDSALFDSSGALPDNAVYHLDLTIQAKTPAGATEAGSCKISADYYRNGGALTLIGTATTIPNYLGGTTNAVAISSNTLLIEVSPGVNTTVGHTITGTLSKRVD